MSGYNLSGSRDFAPQDTFSGATFVGRVESRTCSGEYPPWTGGIIPAGFEREEIA